MSMPSRKQNQNALRIIGGEFGGRSLVCPSPLVTRPMKQRVREATFNLVGPAIRGTHAIDLFAGSGALGLEAISRGSRFATFIERHVLTARLIRQNIAKLQLENRTEVRTTSAFVWCRRDIEIPDIPWIIFCAPPYDFFVERCNTLLSLIKILIGRAPKESIIVVEADSRFDFSQLPCALQWKVRAYPPAVLGVYLKGRPWRSGSP